VKSCFTFLHSSEEQSHLLRLEGFFLKISARPLRGVIHRTAVLSLGWRLRIAAEFFARQPPVSAPKGTLIQGNIGHKAHTLRVSSKVVKW